ncbi:MAG: PAS domain-containing protein [Elusimicrobiota bacterium]|nr:PAS domain-containing protein [Elusimicrobiota bacterium]
MANPMERSSPKIKIIAVLMLAGLLPWLVSLAAFSLFGDTRHIQEPLHEFFELTGTCIALAVAALLLLRLRHEEELQHLFWAAAGLIAMGVVDGLHAVHGISIHSWQRHGATLLGGVLFGLAWLPLPPAVTRRKGLLSFILAGLSLTLGLWWGSGVMPATWDPVGLYTLPVKAANALGGLGFLSAALFFLRRYQLRPNPEDLAFASHTLLFGVSSLLFGYSHTWAADWWAWHGFRLLAYATVLIVGYEMVGLLYRQIGEHAQKLEGLVQARTAELRESENRFRIAAESLTDVVYDWDIKEKVAWYGDIDGITGYPPGAFPRTIKGWAETIHPEDKERVMAALQGHLKGAAHYLSEYRVGRKDGEWRWWSARGTALRDERGEPYKMIGSISDITDRKRAEEDIRRLNSELEQRVAARTIELGNINKELEAFCYSVSHDLRAPLRSIDGFSLALLEDYENKLDGEGQAHLHRIRNSAQRMGVLIDDLLKLSRVSRAEFVRERLDLSALALAVTQELQKTQPERDVECVIQEGISADGDARLLRIVMDNLIGNAWKFTGRQPAARIEFGAVGSGPGTTYFVRDNGAGFDMKYGDKLFSAFQRLHKSEDFPGTGIGLVTVQRIVARHEGRVWAEAGMGKGAAFYFTLGTPKGDTP